MNKAYILKTAKYNPIKDNLSKYESLDLVTRNEYSPSIIATKEEITILVDQKAIEGADLIFHSPSLRTRETAEAIKQILSPNAVLVETPFLAEVYFSLKDLVLEEEYQKEGSNLVRRKFIESLVANNGIIEPRESLLARIKGLFDLSRKKEYQNKKIVCVSHSFFMKVLEIYLKESTLFENPSLLSKYFDWQKRTFDFCQGFYINV